MSMKYKLETTKVFGGKRSLRAGIKRFAPLSPIPMPVRDR